MMAHFVYTAEKNDGEEYKGQAEARDRFELYNIIRREGGRVKSVEEESGTSVWSFAYWSMRMARVKEYEKILFARNLGAMLSAGLSLARALSVMERQTKNVKLARAISEIGSSVRRGDTLHDALAKFPGIFPDLFVAMVRAGEEGGDLPGSLLIVADQTERGYDLKRKIRSAMIYPCIILLAIVGIGTVMLITVVPTLAQTFAEAHAVLPLSTRIVIGISNVLQQDTIFVIAAVLVLIFTVITALKTKIGKRVLDFLLLHLPAIGGIVCEVNAARTARTLSSLLSSGVDMLASLEITYDVVQNSYFREVIKEAQDGVRGGGALSVVFSQHEDLPSIRRRDDGGRRRNGSDQ